MDCLNNARVLVDAVFVPAFIMGGLTALAAVWLVSLWRRW